MNENTGLHAAIERWADGLSDVIIAAAFQSGDGSEFVRHARRDNFEKELDPEALFLSGSLAKLILGLEYRRLTNGAHSSSDLMRQALGHFFPEQPWTKNNKIALTLGHLVTHTAGFDRTNFALATNGQAIADPLIAPPRFGRQAGLVPAYSNFGTMLAARSFEQIVETDLASHYARSAFPSSNMVGSRLLTQPDDMEALEGCSSFPADQYLMNPHYASCGGILLTLDDLGSFARALSHEVLATFATSRAMTSDPASGRFQLQDGRAGIENFLTWFECGSSRIWMHTGSWPGHCALLALDPASKQHVVALAAFPPHRAVPIASLWAELVKQLWLRSSNANDQQWPDNLPQQDTQKSRIYLASTLPSRGIERATALVQGTGIRKLPDASGEAELPTIVTRVPDHAPAIYRFGDRHISTPASIPLLARHPISAPMTLLVLALVLLVISAAPLLSPGLAAIAGFAAIALPVWWKPSWIDREILLGRRRIAQLSNAVGMLSFLMLLVAAARQLGVPSDPMAILSTATTVVAAAALFWIGAWQFPQLRKANKASPT